MRRNKHYSILFYSEITQKTFEMGCKQSPQKCDGVTDQFSTKPLSYYEFLIVQVWLWKKNIRLLYTSTRRLKS